MARDDAAAIIGAGVIIGGLIGRGWRTRLEDAAASLGIPVDILIATLVGQGHALLVGAVCWAILWASAAPHRARWALAAWGVAAALALGPILAAWGLPGALQWLFAGGAVAAAGGVRRRS